MLVTDDEVPIDDDWLEVAGFSESGLKGMTLLLPPTREGSAIAELCIAPMIDLKSGGEGWSVSLAQGVPDDPHVQDDIVALTSLPDQPTRGEMRVLCHALGVDLKA